MRATRNGLVLIVAVVLGALVTGWWTRRDAEPVARSVVETPNLERPAPAPQEIPESPPSPRPGNAGEVSKNVPATAAPPANLSAPPRDDSTYYRMVAMIQSLPRTAEHAGTIAELHEGIVDAPDEPEWARKMERTLLDLYREQAGDGSIRITSVVCRSSGCEVQAVGPRVERRDDSAEEAAPGPRPFPADRPVDSLARPAPVVFVDLGDSMGYLAIYRRAGTLTQ